MVVRELAWRVFAGEYNASSYEFSEGGERAPSYVVSPLGAKINRLFVVGVLTDLENIGTDTEPNWRARICDPTGVFYVYAGTFDPEAAKILSTLEPPTFVAVVGKSRTFVPEGGGTYVSIRPEIIIKVTSEVREYWVLDTCKRMKARIEAIEEGLKMDPPNVDELVALGFNRNLADGVVIALEHYGSVDIERYSVMLVDALQTLTEDDSQPQIPVSAEYGAVASESTFEKTAEGHPEKPPEEHAGEKSDLKGDVSGVSVQDDEGGKVSEKGAGAEKAEETEGEGEEASSKDLEDQLMEIIQELDGGGDGVPWNNLVDKADKAGIEKNKVEELVRSLLEQGVIYEPILGIIKKVQQ